MSILNNPEYNKDEEARKMLEKFLEQHPEIDVNGSEFHEQLMKEQASAKLTKKASELEMAKRCNKITNFGNTVRMTEEQKAASIEYAEKVRKFPKRVKYVGHDKGYNLMQVNKAKVLLWEIMKESLVKNDRSFDATAEAIIRKGDEKIKISYKELISNLVLYFIRNEQSIFDLNKGINIFGEVGTGKSWLMEMFEAFVSAAIFDDAAMNDSLFTIHKMRPIVDKIRACKDFSLLQEYINGQACYDDVGFESTEVKVYGDSDSVFTTIIDTQYERFKKSGKIVHMTTNLRLKDTDKKKGNSIESKYGQRIASRCSEMFNFIFLTGDDKRG